MDIKKELNAISQTSIEDVLQSIDDDILELQKKRFLLNYIYLQAEINKMAISNKVDGAYAEITLNESREADYYYMEATVSCHKQNQKSYVELESLNTFESRLAYLVNRFTTEEYEFFGDIKHDSVVIPLNDKSNSDISSWILSKDLSSSLAHSQLDIELEEVPTKKKSFKV